MAATPWDELNALVLDHLGRSGVSDGLVRELREELRAASPEDVIILIIVIILLLIT